MLTGFYFGERGATRQKARRCDELLELVSLPKKYRLRVVLTLAEEKWLELARSLATNPRLLLRNEVLGGQSNSELLRRIAVFRDIHAKGTPIVMIEHVIRALV